MDERVERYIQSVIGFENIRVEQCNKDEAPADANLIGRGRVVAYLSGTPKDRYFLDCDELCGTTR